MHFDWASVDRDQARTDKHKCVINRQILMYFS
jgi:hypothetical protein